MTNALIEKRNGVMDLFSPSRLLAVRPSLRHTHTTALLHGVLLGMVHGTEPPEMLPLRK